MQPKDISSNHFSGEAGLLGEKSLLIYLVVGKRTAPSPSRVNADLRALGRAGGGAVYRGLQHHRVVAR